MALDLTDNLPPVHRQLRGELLTGLRSSPKYINPKFFYDERGSALFSRICEEPEYYPTRTEISIYRDNSLQIAEAIGPDCNLLEPGAGSCAKVRYLLADLSPATYMPLDISGPFLMESAQVLREDFPALDVQPIVADFSSEFSPPQGSGSGRQVVFYPGSTIGNFEPEQAAAFLGRAREMVGAGGGLLTGVDLHKDPEILNAAYNDAAGVTAEFNRNILQHTNRLLEADFEPDNFEHLAFYNSDQQRIEMHLVSREAQRIHTAEGHLDIGSGECIQTEYSYKYSLESFAALADSAGFRPRRHWLDERGWFSVQYFEAA